jgi:sulfide dehydrogenase cytochrome subunit
MSVLRFTAAAALAAAPLLASAQQAAPPSGRDLSASCAICHGTNGVSPGGMPQLAGQSASTIAQHMRDFRDGKRPATIMHQIAKGYTEPQIEAMAAFFAGQKVK